MEAYPTSEYTARSASGPVIRTSTYKGLTADSRVLVVDRYWPKLIGLRFQFMAYCFHVESGVGWIEVFGGPRGSQLIRAFPVHSIRRLP